MNSSMLLTK